VSPCSSKIYSILVPLGVTLSVFIGIAYTKPINNPLANATTTDAIAHLRFSLFIILILILVRRCYTGKKGNAT
jgi:DMSO/TMAO reductase YedYZ heme-binding membrane subunit